MYDILGELIAKDRINKQAAQKFIVDIFKIKKLSEVEVREHYQIKTSNSRQSRSVERTQHKQWSDEREI